MGIRHTYLDRVRYTLSHKVEKSLEITEPEGWDNDEKELSRHETYHGIFSKFSNHLTFKEDAADYINKIKDIYGINAQIRLARDERHPITDEWVRSYDGFLDLSTWQTENFDVKCKFNASGLLSEIKARSSEKIQIERDTALDGTKLEALKTENLELEGRQVFLESVLEGDPSQTLVLDNILTINGLRFTHGAIPLQVKSKSDERIHATYPNEFGGETIGGQPSVSDMIYLFNDRDKTLKIEGELNIQILPRNIKAHLIEGAFIRVYLIQYENGDSFDYKDSTLIYEDGTPESGLTRTFSASIDKEIDLKANESLGLHIVIGGQMTSGQASYQIDFKDVVKDDKGTSWVRITEDSYFDKSTTKMVMAYELGERIIQIITGRKNAFKSEVLGRTDIGYKQDGEASLKGYSHGHWIRGFDSLPDNELNKYKPFTTSFKDYIEDQITSEDLGLEIDKVGFTEIVNIKKQKDFYLPYITINLGQVSNVKRKNSKENYSSVQIGCTKGWDNEEAMGLDETNAQSSFITPIIRVTNVFKRVTKYIYGSYPKEFIRRKPIKDFPTEDHKNDKEIFAHSLKRDIVFKQRYWQDDFVSLPKGIYSPETATNLNYSPFNLMLKSAWVFMSGLTKNLKEYLRFSSTEGHANITTHQLGGKEYQENKDILISELDKPRYVAEEISFEYEVDFSLIEKIEGKSIIGGKEVRNFYGRIQFTNEKGQLESGYFKSLKPNTNQWVLIKSYE